MTKSKTKKLSSGIMQVFLASISFGFTIFAIVVSLYVYKIEKVQLNERLKAIIETSSSGIAQAIWNFDDRMLQTIIEGIPDDEIVSIKVIDENGKSLAFSQSKFAIKLDNVISYKSEITFENKKIGEIEITASLWKMTNNIKLIFISLVAFSTLLALLVTLISKYFIERNVIKHLTRLKNLANALQKGMYNVTWNPVKIEEIEQLGSSFASMADKIKQRDKELQEYNQNLEFLVTERTDELESQRAKSLNSARLAELGELSAGIAHEINNPLAVISGTADILQRKLQQSDQPKELVLEKLSKIQLMCERINKIIKGLKLFARDGELDPFELVSLQTVVSSTVDLTESRLSNKNIELRIEMPETPIKILGRETQLTQVLGNLVNNAKDAIENLEEKWIQIKVEECQDTVFVKVIDSGKGIPLDIQSKLMNPFFTTKPVGIGTGLGLSISRGIIDSHRGRLEIDNKCHNTCFVISFPKAEEKKESLVA